MITESLEQPGAGLRRSTRAVPVEEHGTTEKDGSQHTFFSNPRQDALTCVYIAVYVR